MTGELFTQIATVLITVFGAVMTYLIIPYIKSRTTQAQQENIKVWVDIAVQAAEQIMNSPGLGENKKVFVLNFFRNRGIDLTDDQLNMLVEAAVYQMNVGKE